MHYPVFRDVNVANAYAKNLRANSRRGAEYDTCVIAIELPKD